MKDKESLLRQKSRQRWLVAGDANTSYFHACIKARRRKNQVVTIMVGDKWVEELEEIKNEVIKHYTNVFLEDDGIRPLLDGITFRQLGDLQNRNLTAVFSVDEVEEAVLSCHGDKAPGPDGFNFSFIKIFWDVLKLDVWGMIEEFHGNAKLSKGITSYFLALIPQCNKPHGLRDFRPISLLGCILSKLLVARLRHVMNSIISPKQSAFLPGRNILDGAAIINEVVDFAKKSKRDCVILKVDFEKAYDSVN